jgi:hypothetical protein
VSRRRCCNPISLQTDLDEVADKVADKVPDKVADEVSLFGAKRHLLDRGITGLPKGGTLCLILTCHSNKPSFVRPALRGSGCTAAAGFR